MMRMSDEKRMIGSMEIRPLSQTEQKYTYTQSMQLEGQHWSSPWGF
jgi:hypothetical protein